MPNQHAHVHTFLPPALWGAHRPPACDRLENGPFALGAGRGVVVLARSHRTARTDASAHAAPTVNTVCTFIVRAPSLCLAQITVLRL